MSKKGIFLSIFEKRVKVIESENKIELDINTLDKIVLNEGKLARYTFYLDGVGTVQIDMTKVISDS